MNLILIDSEIDFSTKQNDEDDKDDASSNQAQQQQQLSTQHDVSSSHDESIDTSFSQRIIDYNKTIVLDRSDPRSKHINKQLRKQKGDCLRIGILDGGPIGQGIISAIRPDGTIHIKIKKETLRPPPSRPRIRILLGIPFPRVIKQLWPILTSFFIETIIYIPSALTDPDYLNSSSLTPKGYMPLIKEGLAQTEDTKIPKVHIVKDCTMKEAITPSSSSSIVHEAGNNCCKILLHLGNYPTIRQCYETYVDTNNNINVNTGGILLAIGPERGWTDDEVNTSVSSNFQIASLGSPILKTETAVISGIALARDVLLEKI